MKMTKYILSLTLIAMVLSGCGEPKAKKGKNQWQDVSLRDLMPKEQTGLAGKGIVGLSLFMFEVEQSKYPKVQAAMSDASELPVTYADELSIRDNGIICGGGGINGWAKIAKSLADSNATVTKRSTIFMDENTSEQVDVAEFPQGTSVNYRSGKKTESAMGLPAGMAYIGIQANSLIGLKQVSRLQISTIYRTNTKKVEDKRIGGWDYAFDSIKFSLPVRAGEFIFMAPQTETQDNILPSVGRMIFTNKQNESKVKFCIIVCGLIKD